YQNLPWRIGNVILSTNHVRNRHQGIIDDHGKVVGRDAFGAHDHRIADHVGVKTDFAPHRVGKHAFAIFRNTKTNGGSFTVSNPLGTFFDREVATPARIARWLTSGQCFAALGLELFAGTEAVVGVTAPHQFLRV